MGVRIRRTLLCLLACLPFRAAAMNDTDGLYGVGVFPIAGSGEPPALAIEREWVDIQLGPVTRRETRRYEILNEGPAGQYEIGWICTVNALNRHAPCTRMAVDGRAVTLSHHNGRVRDPDFPGVFRGIERPPRVEAVAWDPSEARGDAAIETDGTIEAQSWASASIEFGTGQRRILEVEQQRPVCPDYVDFIPDFRLHGERFFLRPSIPEVEFRFEILGGSLDPERFRLRADLAETTRITRDGGAIRWQVRDYPVHESGESGYYGRSLFDPDVPWQPLREEVAGIWQKATGRTSPCETGRD
jgi:hypothetical protein